MSAEATAAVPSPCIRVCQLVRLPELGEVCAGCLRTPEEIRQWSSAGDEYRREVLRRIVLRRD